MVVTPALAVSPNTNVKVSSADVEPLAVEKRVDEKPIFYKDEQVTVGFNDDGDPNVGMRF